MVGRPAPAPVEGWLAPRAAGQGGARPGDAQVMAWLAEVPDPEVPAIGLVDLGVIRGLSWEGTRLTVDVTPTYSGCPATAVIEMMVEDALRRRGLDAHVRRVLSPPWTTDWISPEGRAKLEAYGIAPPDPKGARACPRCGDPRVREVSRFGSTPCKAQWRCDACGEPFDFFKCH
jgi:ring-1,2-phenylacetyl-CoA epoxidase subunit PaaD